ncbi:lethal (3) 07882 [Carabus blaptoides fortunei]
MAKIKKKLAEKVLNKKSKASAKKSLNPFEVHINKQKYEILGQKIKNDRGLPGVSRANAIKKRKRTLLPEYTVKNKSNKFLDRRIGEKNFSMTEEDRQMARFTAERIKHHSKKSIFNLADDEVLTHRGQTLSEIEKFDDPRSDDEDDEEDGRRKSGKLDDNFVGDAHFGGGILSRTGKDGAKSHKDLIEQLIAESKKRKAEKQKTKEQTLELTEKLDSEWKDLLPLVNKSKKTAEESVVHQKPDDYDKVMRELRFEARGNPTDRLKSEDEIAKEEKEKLEKLEQDRLARMRGFVDQPGTKKVHRSADDLEDNFAYDSDPEVTLAYDDEGKLKNEIEHSSDAESNGELAEDVKRKEEADDEELEEEESSEVETDDDLSDLKEDESDSDNEEEFPAKTPNKKVQLPEEETNNEPSLNNDVINEQKRKSAEPKPLQNSEILSLNNSISNEKKRKLDDTKNLEAGSKILKIETLVQETEKIHIDPIVQKEIMEKAQKELPYTYALPESYETLQSLLENQPPEYQDVIVERMIKCNHPSLAAENKENLGRLFVYLLQHLNDVVPDESDRTVNSMKMCFSILNSLTPHLYSLTQLNPKNARDSLIEVINEKQNEYKNKQKSYPGIDVLMFLKLVSCLFSTSDFRHQVVTPSLVFIGQMLTNCKIKTRYDITYGLFLVTLFLEYTSLSKRYMPAAFIYIMGILHMAIPKFGVKLIKIIPPFKPNSVALVLSKKRTKCSTELQMNARDFVEEEIDEDFKVRTIYTVFKISQELHENWNELPSQLDIFEPFLKLLNMIPVQNYPTEIQTEMNKVKNMIHDRKKNKKIEYIVMEKKKPKALRLYEPNIEKVYDYKKHRPMSKEKAEREKLLHKYKKETKGALREIRRDKAFLGRVKIKQQLQSDIERKEKVRRIFSEASMQQGELNAMDRKKKR